MPYKRKDSPIWWVSFTDPSGKRTRRSTGTTDRKEAEALEAKWKLQSYRSKQWDETPSKTFDQLMVAYLRATEGEKRSAERDLYSLKHLYPEFTGRELKSLSSHSVRAYIADRKAHGASAATINREVGLLSSAINYARREWGWNIHNPASSCKQKEPEGRVRWISREEAKTLLSVSGEDKRSQHLQPFIRLALHTGCRKGELLKLNWVRVDLQAGLIRLEAEHTKTGKRRAVPINSEARKALLDRLRFRAEHCPESPWVFCNKDGCRVKDVKRSFATACRRAGILDFRIHDLRHTCAAWLVSAGVPLAEVRDLLGHQTIQMTERYAHLSPENIRQAVKLLEGEESRLGHAAGGG